jgi:hypothetical protein
MAQGPSGPQSPQGGAPGANPASLLGPGASAPPAPSLEQASEAFMMQIRELTIQIDGIAMAHPEVGEDLEIAKQALINAMTKSLMTMSQTEPADAPRLLG